MTNVHDQQDKYLVSNPYIKPGQNAALRGALLAFTKPPLIPQHSKQSSSKTTDVNVSPFVARKSKSNGARHSLIANSPYHHYQEQDRAQDDSSSYRYSPHDFGRSTPFTYAEMKSHLNGLFVPDIHERSRSKSPSNIAANLAVLRHSPQSIGQQTSTIHNRPRSWVPTAGAGVESHVNYQNPSGQVRRWLDDVDVTSEGRNVDVQIVEASPSTYSSIPETMGSIQYVSSLQSISHHRPYYEDIGFDSHETRSHIKSPRPVRISSANPSFEDSARMSPIQVFMPDDLSEAGAGDGDGTVEYDQDLPGPFSTHAEETSSAFSESELAGTAEEEEPEDTVLNINMRPSVMQRTYSGPDPRSSASMTARSMAIPITKPRPPPSLRPVMDARQKVENAKRGNQSATASRSPSAYYIDSLSNAMIASSLAASRAPSPVKSPTPLVSRRHTDHPHLQKSHLRIGRRANRSPSPPHAMPHTLRKAKSSSDEDDRDKEKGRIRRVKRGLHIHKHPHKHHEGDRKRWRDEITPRECKRYEGLWAANRGLLIELDPGTIFDSLNSHVSNIVVRDIWTRSRLPIQVLEEVWDLVDRERVGKLTKEEFVVGMWLVDQRLKGRKLPAKVGQSVWRSARGLYGLKVPRMKD